MKKISVLLFVGILLMACSSGDIGPPGPQGPAGVNILGQVYEVTVNFTPQNNYNVLLDFPQDIEVLESDLVLVYLLETELPDSTGPIAVWSLMPRTFYLFDGTAVVYNFTHTFLDVELFLDGNTNFNTLGTEFTLDQTFRIAIIPSDFAQNPDVDLGNLEGIIQNFQMNQENFSIEKLN